MGILDYEPEPLYTPPAKYRPKDNASEWNNDDSSTEEIPTSG